ncbi:protease inhibitor I42 family protein [Solirubrobacter soli]|uniref:protease inhibitor I42 family protein n=1 Tax=Solirubrobacter soli TaxID=363832 RepID=UPI0003F9C4E0|nr:protease inhibitor I42 family protein [Solirubrobacter soli]
MLAAAFLVALSLANAGPATKTLTSADNGKTITIAKSQELRVDLKECGSCGFSWRTTAKPDPKVLTTRPAITKNPDCPTPKPGDPTCVGGGYTRVFRYAGKADGQTKLRLEYFGPGKKKSSKTFRVTIRVR